MNNEAAASEKGGDREREREREREKGGGGRGGREGGRERESTNLSAYTGYTER
jgi:hypothetical protein